MSDFNRTLARDLSQGNEYRDAYAEAFANEYLATQLQMLRKQRGLTQTELGERIGSNQGRISVFEDPEYGNWSLDTLRKFAREFDLWLHIGFEQYGTLVREVAHFRPENLVRPGFDQDPDIRECLLGPSESDPDAETWRLLGGCLAQNTPDLLQLANWLQGFGLPGFSPRDSNPAQQLLTSIPGGAMAEARPKLAGAVAALLRLDYTQLKPLLRQGSIFIDNLFLLAKALGPSLELQDALGGLYQRSLASGSPGLGFEGESGLLEAMINNQIDDRWHPVWYRYIEGGDYPKDFKRPAHPFLPGGPLTGFRGLLGARQDEKYWKNLSLGIHSFGLRFLLNGYEQVNSEPNLMDEMVAAMNVIFDWWNEPAAARSLLNASFDLMGESWSEHAASAWAVVVVDRGWYTVMCNGTEVDSKNVLDTIVSGLKLYSDWQSGRDNSATIDLKSILDLSEKGSNEIVRDMKVR